jgi:hypothetical protein
MNINDGSDAERESNVSTSASVAWAGQFEAGRQGAARISARWAAPPGAVSVGETFRAQGTVPSRITRDGAVLGHGFFSAQKAGPSKRTATHRRRFPTGNVGGAAKGELGRLDEDAR